jgi:hypothetical protein
MPRPTCLNRRDLLWGSLCLMLAGCRSEPDNTPMAADEQGLKEISAAYRDFCRKNKRGPKTLKELKLKGQSYPVAVQMLNSGELIVQWGAPIATDGSASDAVLAYTKEVPEKGGRVLMQDGMTLKTMSADQFNAAPRAK